MIGQLSFDSKSGGGNIVLLDLFRVTASLFPPTYDPFAARPGVWEETSPRNKFFIVDAQLRMGNSEYRALLVHRVVTRLRAAAWSPILFAVGVYFRKGAAKRDRLGGRDRDRRASGREDDAGQIG